MWSMNPALGRFVWTRHGSMLSSVVRQESGTCVVPCADLSTALTQYTLGPLLPWWHNLPCQICFLCSFRAEARGQHGDVVGPGMSGLLGSARTLLQEYAVKGALLCTAGKKIHMESPPLANDHAWVESSVTYHQKHLSSIQNHHW